MKIDTKLTEKQLSDLKPLFDIVRQNPTETVCILGQPNAATKHIRFIYFDQSESRALKYIITGKYDE